MVHFDRLSGEMAKRSIGTIPDATPLAWSIAKAAREFGLTVYLLTKRLRGRQGRAGQRGLLHDRTVNPGHLWKLALGAAEAGPATSGQAPVRE